MSAIPAMLSPLAQLKMLFLFILGKRSALMIQLSAMAFRDSFEARI